MTLEILESGTIRPEYPHPLPQWVKELRSQQVDAVREIVECLREGVQVVVLDAPVGSGKTLIGELVPRELLVDKRLYMCSDKGLQDQVLRDFPYAKVLKGRANYATLQGRGSITCDDCTANRPSEPCRWCDPTSACPYRVAKEEALGARLAVVNTSYFLHAANYTDGFGSNEFVVADECDLLESALMGFIEYEVPQWIAKRVRPEVPRKSVHKGTLKSWMLDYADDVSQWMSEHGGELEPKQQRNVRAFIMETRSVADMLLRDMELARRDGLECTEDMGHWVRDYDTSTFKLRPVTVAPYGAKRLWGHGQRWLLMSGSVVSAEELVGSTGCPFEYRVVSVPSTFPVENRPVILAPVANVTRANGDREWVKLKRAVERICAEYEGRVLVHTVSYQLAHWLYDRCELGSGRTKFTHAGSHEKRKAIAAYLDTPGAVIFSPSMQRGVDLADEKCRVQIMCKTPYASLGDKQVSSRLHMPDGRLWYAVKTVREIVQMTGRAVRSETDWCTSFILDEQFTRNVWRQYKGMFLPGFRDAVKTGEDIGWLM